MRCWIDVHNDGDLRHLLYEYDESVDPSLLVEIYEAIIKEDEKLTSNNNYDQHLINMDKVIWDGYYINAVSVTIQCLESGRKDLAQKLINEFKLKVKLDDNKLIDRKAIDVLSRLVKSINNKHKMRNLRDKGQKKTKSSWENMQVYIHQVLNILPDYNCTVALYRSYENAARRKVELEKQRRK